MSRRRTSSINIRNFIGKASLRTSRLLSVTSMSPRADVGGLQASTATCFVPSVISPFRGLSRNHRIEPSCPFSSLRLPPTSSCGDAPSRLRPQYPHEALAHARLRVGEMGFEGGEIWHVGSLGEKLREAGAGGFCVKGRRDA